ncbi:enoyl-CoA hydratase/isomerase family protein [Ramlibacter humi]|uniref:Enoyl-CoA hydratase/isomerase family protein n=1 Tax=Ramlibacter humi TaxID=2530451 RepID=A0A4Z0BBQ9_9BURK|nr:enoyl-CoA hydratase/isomerase family protein [Ramlibacter humi]TFY96605.1 enoyl-CoA hydratase/isomerase family protein [Ramlibacter humi]
MKLEFPNLLYEKQGRVATITLNRPHRLNAQDYPSKWDLKSALTHAACDDEVRVVAFRGNGRAFCAGIDLKELSQGHLDERNFALWEECLRIVETMDKIAVALLHGHVLGSGVQLAIACDLRIATPGTQLGLPAGREGLLPGLSVWRLARFIGLGRALDLALVGDSIDGAEAQRIGLLTALVDEADRDAGFARWIDRAVGLSSYGTRATKRAMRAMVGMDYDEALREYLAHQRSGLASADFAEAMTAYREGRMPRWN